MNVKIHGVRFLVIQPKDEAENAVLESFLDLAGEASEGFENIELEQGFQPSTNYSTLALKIKDTT